MEKILKKIETANNSSLMRWLYGFLAVLWGSQPLLRNYSFDSQLDAIIEKIIKSEEPKIDISEYNIIIENDEYICNLWNANKYYAWLNSGRYENKKTGYKYSWCASLPSRYMAELFIKFTTLIVKNVV